MKRRVSLGIALLSLVFGSLPVLAATADPAAEALAAIFAPASAPDPGVPSQPQDAAKLPSITLTADCTAHCKDGSTVSCSGSSCSAIDSACSSGQRGSCTANGVTTYCPSCDCTAMVACSPSGMASCLSHYNDCFELKKCYAECDGVLHWCPSHGVCPF